jgi:hypothetical protein
MKLIAFVQIKGKDYKIYKLYNDKKQLAAIESVSGRVVKFGDPKMPEFPGTPRGNNYCSRSLGIAKKFDIKGDVTTPNFWSRWYLWNCKGNKSLENRPRL